MARLALSKLGLSGNLLKTRIDWPRLDKAGPGWTRPAWAGQGQWKSPFRVVDWPGPACQRRPGQASVIFTGLGWPGPAQAGHVLSGPAQASLGWPGPAQPGRFFARETTKKEFYTDNCMLTGWIHSLKVGFETFVFVTSLVIPRAGMKIHPHVSPGRINIWDTRCVSEGTTITSQFFVV